MTFSIKILILFLYLAECYSTKMGLSHDMLKCSLLEFTETNHGPYHIVVVSSDAGFRSTISNLVKMGFIVHVACKNDAHYRLKQEGYVIWNWDFMIIWSKLAFKINY